jgi:phosphate transport system substrate-binding protein
MERIERTAQKRVRRDIKRFLIVFALLCSALWTAGCVSHDPAEGDGEESVTTELNEGTDGSPTAEKPAPDLHLEPEEYPPMDGSALMAPFSEALASEIMDLPVSDARLYVLHTGMHEAYTNLIDGKVDIIFATPPSETELTYAENRGVALTFIPILNDAFVFFVNADNPVNDISLEDLVGIYSGKINNWKDVGGDDMATQVCYYPENSENRTGLFDLIMNKTPLAQVSKGMVFTEAGEIMDAVAYRENAVATIGYAYYYNLMHMRKDDAVKHLKINGVAPDTESIEDGSYPVVATIYMALRQNEPSNSVASRLADWISSDAGKAIAERTGYIPIR